MPDIGNSAAVTDARRALAFVMNTPADQIHGYLVIITTPEGRFMVTTNLTTVSTAVALMADTIADLLADHSPEDPWPVVF